MKRALQPGSGLPASGLGLRCVALALFVVTPLLVTPLLAQPSSRVVYSYLLPLGETINTANIAVDKAGNSYVSVVQAVTQADSSVIDESYLIYVSADGSVRTVLDTLSNQIITALAVGASGDLYAAGWNGSTGYTSGFLAKFSPSGGVLFNQTIAALPAAIALDSAESIYLAGNARVSFVATPGAFQTALSPGECFSDNSIYPCPDAFVAKYNADGSGPLYSTLFGGAGADFANAIAVDITGSVYIAGNTNSSNLPVTAGAFQSTYGGGPTLGPLTYGDGFAAKIDPTGSKLIYATYIGGSQWDFANGIAVDANQNAYVVGTTASGDFPVLNAYQVPYGGPFASSPSIDGNAFFLKLGSSGQGIFSSYLGTYPQYGNNIVLGTDGRGYLTVTGPLLALHPVPPTSCDPGVSIAAFDTTSGQVIDTTGVTGLQSISGNGLAIDGSGLVHVAGTGATDALSIHVSAPSMASSIAQTPAFMAVVDFNRADEFIPYCIANGASFLVNSQTVAPGQIISIFGLNIGQVDSVVIPPRQALSLDLGVTVTMGGVALPLLYSSSSQVNAVIPYDTPVGATTLTIAKRLFTATYPITVVSEQPGVFTFSPGQLAAVVNQNGLVNGPDNPAPVGSIVAIYATGFGAIKPSPADSTALNPLTPPFASLTQSFALYMSANVLNGAVELPIVFAGPAPGQPPGLYQVNAMIPAEAASGNGQFQFVFTDGQESQTGVFIYLQPPQ